MEAPTPAATTTNSLYEQLFGTFGTYFHVNKAYRILHDYLNEVVYGGTDHPADVNAFMTQTGVVEPYKSWLTNQVASGNLKQFTATNVVSTIKQLKDTIDTQPRVTLYVPFVFPEEKMDELIKRARDAAGRSVLIDIHYDEDLLAGCALVWNGTYRDYSLRGRIRDSGEEIKKVLGSFNQN